MRTFTVWSASALLVAVAGSSAAAQKQVLPTAVAPIDSADPVALMVARLDLERYKTTLKGLTQFGDRKQGTKRNRDAVDWIEAQLKSYGCSNTERIIYRYEPPTLADRPAAPPAAATPPAAGQAPLRRVGPPATQASGGGRNRGIRTRTGVNNDSLLQPDPTLRALNAEPSMPGERQEVYCTKIGTTHPEEMYIVGAHMDGIGWGEAVNDDGSGTALVMELARVFSSPDVQTERSIRFVLWNNEESGLNGARAYIEHFGGDGGHTRERLGALEAMAHQLSG